jgi:hypothetical protein
MLFPPLIHKKLYIDFIIYIYRTGKRAYLIFKPYAAVDKPDLKVVVSGLATAKSNASMRVLEVVTRLPETSERRFKIRIGP